MVHMKGPIDNIQVIYDARVFLYFEGNNSPINIKGMANIQHYSEVSNKRTVYAY